MLLIAVVIVLVFCCLKYRLSRRMYDNTVIYGMRVSMRQSDLNSIQGGLNSIVGKGMDQL